MLKTITNNTKTILVFTSELARYLLKLNYQIVDIKPHRDGNNKTVYAFIDEQNIKNKVMEYKSKIKNIENIVNF